MALNAYLKLKGSKQGDIKGSVTLKGSEGMIAVHSFQHEITSPRDPASGQATGKRVHKPFIIIKEVDMSTPKIYSALTNNESLKTWELKCYDTKGSPASGAGKMVNVYTIILTNASVIGVQSIMENNLEPDGAKLPLMEEVSFVYEKITWIWVDGGITHEDNWNLTSS